MAISKQKKVEILSDLNEKVKKAKSIVFAENKGLTVKEITDFRATLRAKGSEFGLAKKTLFKKALAENGVDTVDESVWQGAIGAIFAFEDEMANIQIAAKFAKKNEKLLIHGGVFEGKGLNAAQMKALATLPSRNELLAKLLGTLNAPISGFVGVGSAVISSFVRACSEVAKKKEAA